MSNEGRLMALKGLTLSGLPPMSVDLAMFFLLYIVMVIDLCTEEYSTVCTIAHTRNEKKIDK